MRLEFLLLADHVNLTVEGKFNIIGEFNRLVAASFPVIHPMMYIVARVSFPGGDVPTRSDVLFQLVRDRDQATLIQVSTVPSPPPDPSELPTDIPDPRFEESVVVPLFGTVLPEAGIYTVRLVVDGTELGRRRLHVAQQGEPAARA